MIQIQPTYLRYINDELLKGKLNAKNPAGLPDGFAGIYDEVFTAQMSVKEREKLLQQLAVWALLKKEVSASFVAEVLETTIQEVQELLGRFSSWFNSPESGKYQLYHERLKVYLLQKLSEKEIHTLHEKLIARLEQAIEDQKADEFEWYGLEFLAGHYEVNAMLTGDGSKLLALPYSQSHWQRQLKISKGYTWTKAGLRSVMTWASKYNDDEVIECGLQMVDLHHQEQNAAPQIVALVAEGDFDVALKRIEEFGSNDKEGIQRKFILYMLCFMELTLLESKDKPFRKEGIEKLLKHLDEHLPVDHSVLNWNDFFPSYLMFQLACCCEKMDLEFLTLFNRTNQWDTTWLKTKESFKEVEIAVLLKLNKSIADFEKEKRNKMQRGTEMLDSIVFFILSRTDILLALNNKGEKSISKEVFEDIMGSFSLLPIWDWERRTLTLIDLFQKFTKVFEVDDFVFLLKDAYSLVLSEDEALNLLNSYQTQDIIEKIVRGYIKCGKINEAYHITISHLEDSISYGMKFSNAIKDIALAHASNGNIEEAKLMVKEIPESSSESIVLKSGALAALSSECSFQNKFEEAIAFMSDAKLILNDLFIDYNKYEAYKSISIELTKQNKWEEAMELTKKISKNYWFRSSALCAIARVNNSSMNFDHSMVSIHEAILSEMEIDDDFHRTNVQCEICDFYITNRDFKSAILYQKKILNSYAVNPNEVLIKIYRGVSLHEDYSSIYSLLLEHSVIPETKTANKIDFLKTIIYKYASKLKLDEANFVRQILTDKDDKLRLLLEIYEVASKSLNKLAIEDRAIELNHMIETVQKINYDLDRDKVLGSIIPAIFDSGQLELSVKIANERSTTRGKLFSFCLIAQKLFEVDKKIEAETMLNQVLDFSKRIYDEEHFAENKASIMLKVSSVYISIDNYSKAKELLDEVLKLGSSNTLDDYIVENIAIQYASMDEVEKSIEIIEKIRAELFPGEVYLKIYDIFIKNRKLHGLEILTEVAIEKSKAGIDKATIIKRTLKISDKLYAFGSKNISDNIIKNCILELRMIQDEHLKWFHIFKQPIEKDFIYGSNYVIDSLVRQNKLDELWEFACQIAVVHENVWFMIGQSLVISKEYHEVLNILKQFKDPQILFSIIEGISNAICNDYKVSEDVIVPLLKLNSNNINLKEHVLSLHALNQLFFSNLPQEKIDRFNRTLNIQWAIDIKNQLPN